MFVIFRIVASIFYQILYMSIIASILGLVILLIQKIINKRISPKFNCFIWLVFIFVLIFPISITSKFSIYNHIDFNKVKVINIKNSDEIDINKNEMLSNWIDKTWDNNIEMIKMNIKSFIASSLLFVSVIKALSFISSYYLTIKVFGENKVVTKRIVDIFNDCKKELNIKRNIKIINQSIVDSPAIIGLFNVKILFSNNLLLLNDDNLKNMFLHELAHYKRKDNFMNFLIMILSSIYWFNPIIKLIFKYIKKDIEFATDELAIKKMNIDETRNYCRTIVEAKARTSGFLPILSFAGELENIEKRIDLISLRNQFRKRSKIIAILTFFIVTFLCLIFYPTSYCNTNIPKLYLKTDDGIYEKIDIVNNKEKIKEITIKEGVNTQIVSDNLCKDGYIYFNCSQINNIVNSEGKNYSIVNNDINCLNKGEFLCNFYFVTKNKKNFEYVIKIKVV